MAILLQFKPEMHRFAETLGNDDLKAIMQFVLITCIILPVLPDQTYGPFDVFNPWKTWLMVVLIVGMSLGGYILYKFLGRDAVFCLVEYWGEPSPAQRRPSVTHEWLVEGLMSPMWQQLSSW